MDELEHKVPVFKKWRIENFEEKKPSVNAKKKRFVYIKCTKLQTEKYPVFNSYKPLSINKIYV